MSLDATPTVATNSAGTWVAAWEAKDTLINGESTLSRY